MRRELRKLVSLIDSFVDDDEIGLYVNRLYRDGVPLSEILLAYPFGPNPERGNVMWGQIHFTESLPDLIRFDAIIRNATRIRRKSPELLELLVARGLSGPNFLKTICRSPLRQRRALRRIIEDISRQLPTTPELDARFKNALETLDRSISRTAARESKKRKVEQQDSNSSLP